MRVLTIGFTRKSAQRFFELLRESGAKRIVDVRLNNGSQLAGFAKKDDLARFARELCGVEYVHLPIVAPTKVRRQLPHQHWVLGNVALPVAKAVLPMAPGAERLSTELSGLGLRGAAGESMPRRHEFGLR